MKRQERRVDNRVILGLTTTMASQAQQWGALIMGGMLVLMVLLIFPVTSLPLAPIPPFIVLYSSFIFYTDMFTCYLLFGQFIRTRSPSILVLGTGYLFTGCIILPYLLTFPGVFSKTGLLNAGTQTASWLWVFWHSLFSLYLLLYAVLDRHKVPSQLSVHQAFRAIVLVLSLVPLIVIALTLIAIYSDHFLPILIINGNFARLTSLGIGPGMCFVSLCACLACLFRARRGSLVTTWVSVTALAELLSIVLNMFAGSRFTIGWYLARVNNFIAATAVLCVLLYEVNRLSASIIQQNQHLEDQNEMQRNFVSVVSHEFRTALTSIQGFSEMMHDQDFSPEEIKDFSGDMSQSAQRLTRLIDDVLDLERMRSGKMQVVFEPVDVNVLLTEIVKLSYALPSSCPIQLDLGRGLLPIQGDADKLTQVITNLLSNAIKYSPVGGSICLKSWQEGSDVCFSVQDHGIGISQEALERIFDRYIRIEAKQQHYISGAGLGLSIVREIVEMHGGRVYAESTPGQGSTFHVILPLVQPQ